MVSFESILREQLGEEKARAERIQNIRQEMGMDEKPLAKPQSQTPQLKKQSTLSPLKTRATKSPRLNSKQLKRLAKARTQGVKKRSIAVTRLLKAFTQPIKVQRKLSPQQLANLKRFQQLQRMKSPDSNLNKQAVMQRFYESKRKQHLEDRIKNEQLSASFRYQQEALRQIQTKAIRDNLQQQRRLRERSILSKQMDLMQAHLNNPKIELDFTKLPDGDLSILNAPNVFRENPENNILRSKRPSILNTRETGNQLFF